MNFYQQSFGFGGFFFAVFFFKCKKEECTSRPSSLVIKAKNPWNSMAFTIDTSWKKTHKNIWKPSIGRISAQWFFFCFFLAEIMASPAELWNNTLLCEERFGAMSKIFLLDSVMLERLLNYFILNINNLSVHILCINIVASDKDFTNATSI